jgi:hypothetical protein
MQPPTGPGTAPDPNAILQGLKDFQRRTVEHAFRRLYLDADSTHRFLVADEVGLGKTMIARGVIAKTVEHLWNQVDRIDIVYVCSNAEIARQNIDRLRLDKGSDFARATRATLLPLEIKNMHQQHVNFISMTPGTSLEQRGGTGIAKERALLLRMLLEPWDLNAKQAINVLRCDVKYENFEWWLGQVEMKDIDQSLREKFLADLNRHMRDDELANRPSLLDRLNALCEALPRRNSKLDAEQLIERRRLVSELRSMLGRSCIHALRPDLVILDEFQRFKHLMEPVNSEAELARSLFEYADEREGKSEAVRMLLLSATPYKMYSLQQEADRGEGDHYEDFVATYGFLTRNSEQKGKLLRGLLRDFRLAMYRLGDGGLDRLREIKGQMEQLLRQVMARTERLAVTDDRSGMLKQRNAEVTIEETDIDQYLAVSAVAKLLGHGNIVEYWKSAPYLLNFMDDYQLKQDLKDSIDNGQVSEIARTLRESSSGLLKWKDVLTYQRVDAANARLRFLLNDTVEKGLWKLLWLPPSMPYYKPEGNFSEVNPMDTTKRLVFSSWQVVPKVIAAIVSHEAERQAMAQLPAGDHGTIENSAKGRKKITALLRFQYTDGRLTGMPVLNLLYPSSFLSRVFDPACVKDASTPAETVLKNAAEALKPSLDAIVAKWSSGSEVDEKWYWAAPILLDFEADKVATCAFWKRPDLASDWNRMDGTTVEENADEGDDKDSGWEKHVKEAQSLLTKVQANESGLLGQPPADLLDVLSRSLMGSPSVLALRAIVRIVGVNELTNVDVRLAAARVAWRMRNLFNLPEVIAIVRGLRPVEPYWLRAIEYCVDGCLQSVFDEYAHVLRDSLGVAELGATECAEKISETMCTAIGLRAAGVGVDELRAGPEGTLTKNRHQMRSRFAARFGHSRSEEDGEATRSDHVRGAFNSPFWPFVLASTSVGQEGLDFHHYCHAIVHWNLPSNPVDLEQREGRIHRFKGHAVRKNVALKHAEITDRKLVDRWQAAFDLAEQNRKPSDSELVPFWVFPHADGASIDRYVPSLPLSSDVEKLTRLRNTLAIYRMVVGQPRQDELVAWLLQNFDAQTVSEISAELRIDLEPPRKSHGATTD